MKVEDIRKNHITLRKYYFNSVKNKQLKRIFRPGNRICPNNKCYSLGQLVYIKILDIQGSDKYNIEPIHTNFKSLVKITNSVTKKLVDLKKGDFKNSGFDIKDINSLRTHLALIYNLYFDEVNDDNFEITITDFEYI